MREAQLKRGGGEENGMNECVKQCFGGKFMNERMEGSYLLLYPKMTGDGG